MFKLFHKKLNKKGFTLAELLVVVAIIAILIAIAVPIFTKSMREAQLRTNQANMRSVKAAGVTEILSDWGKYSRYKASASSTTSSPAEKWYVVARVDVKGNISDVAVFSSDQEYSVTDDADAIAVSEDTDTAFALTSTVTRIQSTSHVKNLLTDKPTFATGTDIDADRESICNVSASSNQCYVVFVCVTDVDFE